MKKIVIFVGSRANHGRLISLIKALEEEFNVYIIGACTLDKVEHSLATNLYIHADMYDDIPGNKATTISLVAITATTWLMGKGIDLAIVHGDRFECLGFAIAVNANGIPLIHMEAGEITNIDNDVRWAISALSKYHLCPTVMSTNRMLSPTGLYNPYFVGSPIVDYIKQRNFKSKKPHHILILYNPVTNKEFFGFSEYIEDLILAYSNTLFKWVNPNIDPGNREIVRKMHQIEKSYRKLEFLKNLNQDDYLQLITDSIFMTGNTSSGIKEGYVLGVPFLMYGTRQGNREVFANTQSFYTKSSILKEAKSYLTHYKQNSRELELNRVAYKGELGKGNCVKKVIEFIGGVL
jgi:GDP/UDP-N,N'-diacetylbacillosamine 2-epimerase (hydrolysing)